MGSVRWLRAPAVAEPEPDAPAPAWAIGATGVTFDGQKYKVLGTVPCEVPAIEVRIGKTTMRMSLDFFGSLL